MKGLILKDLYMSAKYCRSYLFLIIIFSVLNFLSDGSNATALVYPCMLAGMLPVTLLGYDERSGWMLYANTLPYTKLQLVTSKYLFGLFVQLASSVILIGASVLRCLNTKDYNYISSLPLIICISIILFSIMSATTLPFMFKYGVEKGRVINMVAVGIICAVGAILATTLGSSSEEGNDLLYKIAQLSNNIQLIMIIATVVAVAVYIVSWWISVKLLEKREVR